LAASPPLSLALGTMIEKTSRRTGVKAVEDPDALSADPNLPAFLAPPIGSPVYHGFPLLSGGDIDGWQFGIITSPRGKTPCKWGDAFVVAPDGSRAGIVWAMEGPDFSVVVPPEEGRWGVYHLRFRHNVYSDEDLARNLHEFLPLLMETYAKLHS